MTRSLRWFRTWLVIAYAGVVLDIWFSLAPPGAGEPLLPDKLMHFLVYFFLAGWFAGLYPRRTVIIAVALIALGALLEILQPLTGRSMELADGVTNAAGVLAGLLLVRALPVNLFAWLESRLDLTQ